VSVLRGEVWWASLDPTVGSEQAGRRPVLIIQNSQLNAFTATVLAIPLTSNLRRAQLPSAVLIPRGEGGLSSDSVVLCHQLRVLAVERLTERLGILEPGRLSQVESALLFTLGIAGEQGQGNAG